MTGSPSSSDSPTEVLPTIAPGPTRRSILHSASAQPERPASPFADWRGQAPTEALPAVSSSSSSSSSPRRDRPARRPARRPALARHLRAALAGLLTAAAILIPMQLFAAQGISSARQAALSARAGQAEQAEQAPASAVPMSGQSTHSEQGAPSPMSGQSPAPSGWVTETTHAAYDRTNPAASPLTLPRCTASPDTPLPCLATISPSQTRAVVLEEDASLTALVRR